MFTLSLPPFLIGQTSKLYGHLIDTTNVTLDFAAVKMKSPKAEFKTISDENGNFGFSNLIPDTYRLTVEYLRLVVDTQISISDNDSLWLNLLSPTGHIVCIEYVTLGVNDSMAVAEIKAGKPRLFLKGGIVVPMYTDDKIFENKYKVKYFDFGCNHSWVKGEIKYNQVVFKYLDKKYKKRWRKDVRKDVVGL